jgi:hypothetical protein
MLWLIQPCLFYLTCWWNPCPATALVSISARYLASICDQIAGCAPAFPEERGGHVRTATPQNTDVIVLAHPDLCRDLGIVGLDL